MLKKSFLLIALIAGVISCQSQNLPLKEGDKAPDFTLKSDEGKDIQLSDFKGKSNVVLYFYPKDETSGCTKEACSFRDHIADLASKNTVVLGVSVDDINSHQSFKKKENLNFTLLADPDKTVSTMYSGLSSYGMSRRVTFLINKKGIIEKIFPKVNVDEHYAEIMDALKKIN